MYLIVQSRWLRGSTQSGENVIDTSTRKKEAKGLVRHNFYSTLNVIAKHFMYEVEDFDIDEENYSITLADAEGVWFHTKFFVLET